MGRFPAKSNCDVHGAIASQLELEVGGLEHDAELRLGQPGDGVEDGSKLILFHRTLFPVVEHSDDVVGAQPHGLVLEEVEHDRHACFHVGGTESVKPPVLDVGGRLALMRHGVDVAHEEHERAAFAVARHETVADPFHRVIGM